MPGKRKIVGPRSQIHDLIYDPVNEQGVIFLFAKYHKELGIDYIEGIQQGFPDAFGRRKIGKEVFEPVNIEFEFESIDFKRHQHDSNECDIIVCWKHNWSDCPIEVIELRNALPNLSTGTLTSVKPLAARSKIKGKVTHQEEYRIPILETLIEIGGMGKTKKILEKVEIKMRNKLTTIDYEKLPSGRYIRWKNYAMWERKKMIFDGLLKEDSPRGVWEITKKGRNYFTSKK